MDESTPTCDQRFAALGIAQTAEMRRAYREHAPDDAGPRRATSAARSCTTRRSASRRTPACRSRRRSQQAGIVPGHQGRHAARKPLAGFPGEVVTEGLDGLRDRLAEYARLGARFAKWRAVITIGDDIPTPRLHRGQRARAGALRRAVPGSGPGADRRARSADGRRPHARALREVTEATLHAVFDALHDAARHARRHAAQAEHGPAGQGLRRPGDRRRRRRGHASRCLLRAVPAAVPGIAFLSGGQTDAARDRAPQRDERRLRARACRGRWRSRSRARSSSRRSRSGAATRPTCGAAQQALFHRAACNRAARRGATTPRATRRRRLTRIESRP